MKRREPLLRQDEGWALKPMLLEKQEQPNQVNNGQGNVKCVFLEKSQHERRKDTILDSSELKTLVSHSLLKCLQV